MESYLRSWRESLLSKHQYDAAVFVGDKLLALTNSDEDAFALAQTHFSAGNYTRALSFLIRSDLLQRSPAARYLAAHCHIRQEKYEDAMTILGDKTPFHLFTSPDAARRKLQHVSNPSLTGRQNGKARMPALSDRMDRSEEREQEGESNIKYEAGMCYLRGVCYAKQNAFDRAKECYKDAVRIDVQCFEAFNQLVQNSLMSPKEEWDFLNSLNYDSVLSDGTGDAAVSRAEAADFTKALYITRLSKYAEPELFNEAVETLSTHYRLSQNADILLCKAEMQFALSRFHQALALTSQILETDPYNFACLPLHLAVLYQLKHNTSLFAISHDLADTHPSEPCTWLAVGTYYLAINRIPEARSYFSKASLMDPHFGPAWIGFAHTFAAEGESDQAIAAYSTAARLFQGTHFPQLFLGMQETTLGNLNVAREYLTAAYHICPRDPQLINELGVVSYLEDSLDAAAQEFQLAIEISKDNGTPELAFAPMRLNLAHTLRRLGHLAASLAEYDAVLRHGLRDPGVFTARALVCLELDDPLAAVRALHEALAVAPQDPLASDLLAKALAALEESDVLGGADERAIDVEVMDRLRKIRLRREQPQIQQPAQAQADRAIGGRATRPGRTRRALAAPAVEPASAGLRLDDEGMSDVDDSMDMGGRHLRARRP